MIGYRDCCLKSYEVYYFNNMWCTWDLIPDADCSAVEREHIIGHRDHFIDDFCYVELERELKLNNYRWNWNEKTKLN